MTNLHPDARAALEAYQGGTLDRTPTTDVGWLTTSVFAMQGHPYIRVQMPVASGTHVVVWKDPLHSTHMILGSLLRRLCTNLLAVRRRRQLQPMACAWAPQVDRLSLMPMDHPLDTRVREAVFAHVERLSPLPSDAARQLRKHFRSTLTLADVPRLRTLRTLIGSSDDPYVRSACRSLLAMERDGVYLTRWSPRHLRVTHQGRVVVTGYTHWSVL